MQRWLIGDIQGCFSAFQALLRKINFDPRQDKLYPLGDLVNRGEDDLATLEWLFDHRHCVFPVLGNHDLHMLAAFFLGLGPGKSDTFEPILNANNANELCLWLSEQPLARYFPTHKLLISHAGIPPCWSLEDAMTLSNEIQSVLRSDQRIDFFHAMYGDTPAQWCPTLKNTKRWRVITNYFTRMRFITKDNALNLKEKGEKTSLLEDLQPWFNIDRDDDLSIAFGHWAALCGESGKDFALSLDGGCVWGGSLIAYNLESRQRISVNNPILQHASRSD